MGTAQFLLTILRELQKKKDQALQVAVREEKNLAINTRFVNTTQFVGYKLELFLFPFGESPVLPHFEGGTWETFNVQHLIDTLKGRH